MGTWRIFRNDLRGNNWIGLKLWGLVKYEGFLQEENNEYQEVNILDKESEIAQKIRSGNAVNNLQTIIEYFSNSSDNLNEENKLSSESISEQDKNVIEQIRLNSESVIEGLTHLYLYEKQKNECFNNSNYNKRRILSEINQEQDSALGKRSSLE